MKEKWNDRYGTAEYIFGREPNEFLRSTLSGMKIGRILLPGDGEGRNSVYAASLGWDAHAFDTSDVGREKALKLAAESGVSISYEIADAKEFSPLPGSYDALALIFFHLKPIERYLFHNKMASALKPGGYVIMEAFSRLQLGNKSGGPREGEADRLYNCAQIAVDFEDFYVEKLCNCRVKLTEGPGHEGEAEVIRFIGRKI